jgi:hypothetical protein
VADSDNVAATDPWSDGKLCTPEDHWNLEKDGCPLVCISELLLNWPGSTPTIDLSNERKIERLVAIILGYPKISRGMYPLDWPTHPESLKAMRLSLFLDSINCARFPGQSLRTSISITHRYYKSLLPQIKENDEEKKQIREISKWCRRIISMIFDSIRGYKQKEPSSEKNLGLSEMRVLSALHSSSGEMREEWAVGKPTYKKIHRGGNNLDMAYILSNLSLSTHSFKVTKIQTWIDTLTRINFEGEYPVRPSLRHNILAGCSTIIDSIFAKLRDVIVTKYGASSVIIDGGGRIAFVSDEPKNEIEESIKENLYRTLLISKDYIHPFNNIIESTTLEEGILKQYDEKGADLFNKLVGVAACKELFPPISCNIDKHDEKYEFYQDSNCVLCNPEIYMKDNKLANQTKDWDNTCFPHKLIYNIGRSAKRRDTSWRSVGSTSNFDPEEMVKINSIAVFDLNSLGFMFKNDDNSMQGQIKKMRKSFKFNAAWWRIIADALNDKTLDFASLNSWIAAGDDITLVMRGIAEFNQLIEVLESLDLKLKHTFDNLDTKFSFGAGVAKKTNDIFSTLKAARASEKKAKEHWKFRANEYQPELIETEVNGEITKKEFSEFHNTKILNKNTIVSNQAHRSVVYIHEEEEE